MQLANGLYQVLSVNPVLKTKTRRWIATVNGEPTIQAESKSYQTGTCTDGSEFQGEKTIYQFETDDLNVIEVGDAISGRVDHRTPTLVSEALIERGKNAVRPLKLTPKPLPSVDFNKPDPNVEYSAPAGAVLTFADLTQMVQELQRRVRALESKL